MSEGGGNQKADGGASTLSVHGGEDRHKLAKSLTTPIAQTSTFVFDDLDDKIALPKFRPA